MRRIRWGRTQSADLGWTTLESRSRPAHDSSMRSPGLRESRPMQLIDFIARVLATIVAWFRFAQQPAIRTGAGAVAATAYLFAY
jgi:hypothetical protein